MGKLNNMKNNISYFIKKNIFIVLVLISLCPVLALSYAKFTINSESYRSNEMYISELLYSIKIDDENTYTIDIDPGETEHTIEITSLSGISTNYKLAYLNNDKLEVKYASDYMDASFGGIIMTRTMSLTIKNTSTEKQTLSLMVFGGYSFNEVEEVKVLETYTEIDTNYLHYDYETTALYVDNTRVDKLDSSKNYTLVNYTCTNDAIASYDALNRQILIKSDNQTKCSLYFEENTYFTLHLINNYQTLGLTKIEQTATGNQNYNTIEYRYQGASPNNYIIFNDEVGKWRIIGVFEVETPNGNGTYTKEYKVKIIRDSIGDLQYNTVLSGTNYSDWTTSTLMTMLNQGAYYSKSTGNTIALCSNKNGTLPCSYESTGLISKYKSQISTTKYYLGAISWNDSYGNAKTLYKEERGNTILSGSKETWDGNIALMYPSDYMYASSECYNDDSMLGVNPSDSTKDYGNNKCKNSDWLLPQTNWNWLISPYMTYTYNVITLVTKGTISDFYVEGTNQGEVKPVLYLTPELKHVKGDGSKLNPFVID